ncbi:MAG: leucine-rich repeat protein [Methanomassiliicoccales archaeon]
MVQGWLTISSSDGGIRLNDDAIELEKKSHYPLGLLILLVFMTICTILILSPGNATAETSGDFDYALINDGTEVEITGYHGISGDINIPSIIEGKLVTSIGNNAFRYCTSLISVTIPESVTRVGASSFYYCTSLTSVTIPESVTFIGAYGFYHTSLISVTIPVSLTFIPDYMCGWCTSLTTVTISNSVTMIGKNSFAECKSLTSITIPSSVTSIGNGAFCLTGLTAVTIPNSVTTIGIGAFAYTSLTSITIPSSVTSIGNGAFSSCSLRSIDVNVDNQFYLSIDGVLYDKAITNLIQFPGGIGGEFEIPNSIISIGGDAFQDCRSLTYVKIPDSVITIGSNAFWDCNSLTSIIIPSGVTRILSNTFYRCYSLTSITIPSSVMEICGYAFQYCTSLTNITLPSSIEKIRSYAFGNCVSLTQIYFEGDAPTIDSNSWIYEHNPNLIIYYYFGNLGFSTPTWYGVPTVCIYPIRLSITPLSTTVEPGNISSFTVSLANPGPTTRTVDVVLDNIYSSDPRIPLGWFILSTNQVTLGPGSIEILTLSIMIPSTWAAVENVMTSISLSVTNEPGTIVYDSVVVGVTVKATDLSAIFDIYRTTADIVTDIELVQANPTVEGIDNIRLELVGLISKIQCAMDHELLNQTNGQALLASANAALNSVERSDEALDDAKMKLVSNALETAQNQLEALINKLEAEIESN